MTTLLPFILFAIGLVLIIKGSDWFVTAAIWVARTFGVPDIIIGATLVSLCTTLPESLVSITAAAKAIPNPELSLSNALGSIACNTGLIMPICIIVAAPEWHNRESFRRNGMILVALFAAVYGVAIYFGAIPRAVGVILLLICAWYLFDNVRQGKRQRADMSLEERPPVTSRHVFINIALLAVGITMTIVGANLLVTNTERIARFFGVPDLIIGITLTALGTSLPELMTCITAIMKKAHNISLGNIIGADILNILVVVGGSAAVIELPTQGRWLTLQFPLTLAILLVTVACSFTTHKRFERRYGFMIFALYATLITLSIMG